MKNRFAHASVLRAISFIKHCHIISSIYIINLDTTGQYGMWASLLLVLSAEQNHSLSSAVRVWVTGTLIYPGLPSEKPTQQTGITHSATPVPNIYVLTFDCLTVY